MTNVLFAGLNRKHYVTFYFTVSTQICCGKMLTVLFNNNKGISRVVFTRGYNWNNEVKMPLVKLSDINW